MTIIGGTGFCGHGVMRSLCPQCTPPNQDWADEAAAKHLRYLDKCSGHAEQREYLAAALRVAKCEGKMVAGEEFAAALGVKLERGVDQQAAPEKL